jgi:hypothetical protein
MNTGVPHIKAKYTYFVISIHKEQVDTGVPSSTFSIPMFNFHKIETSFRAHVYQMLW